MTKIYKEGGNIWKKTGKSNKNLFSDRSDRNDSVCFSGVVLEAYINPEWMRWILGRLC